MATLKAGNTACGLKEDVEVHWRQLPQEQLEVFLSLRKEASQLTATSAGGIPSTFAGHDGSSQLQPGTAAVEAPSVEPDEALRVFVGRHASEAAGGAILRRQDVAALLRGSADPNSESELERRIRWLVDLVLCCLGEVKTVLFPVAEERFHAAGVLARGGKTSTDGSAAGPESLELAGTDLYLATLLTLTSADLQIDEMAWRAIACKVLRFHRRCTRKISQLYASLTPEKREAAFPIVKHEKVDLFVDGADFEDEDEEGLDARGRKLHMASLVQSKRRWLQSRAQRAKARVSQNTAAPAEPGASENQEGLPAASRDANKQASTVFSLAGALQKQVQMMISSFDDKFRETRRPGNHVIEMSENQVKAVSAVRNYLLDLDNDIEVASVAAKELHFETRGIQRAARDVERIVKNFEEQLRSEEEVAKRKGAQATFLRAEERFRTLYKEHANQKQSQVMKRAAQKLQSKRHKLYSMRSLVFLSSLNEDKIRVACPTLCVSDEAEQHQQQHVEEPPQHVDGEEEEEEEVEPQAKGDPEERQGTGPNAPPMPVVDLKDAMEGGMWKLNKAEGTIVKHAALLKRLRVQEMFLKKQLGHVVDDMQYRLERQGDKVVKEAIHQEQQREAAHARKMVKMVRDVQFKHSVMVAKVKEMHKESLRYMQQWEHMLQIQQLQEKQAALKAKLEDRRHTAETLESELEPVKEVLSAAVGLLASHLGLRPLRVNFQSCTLIEDPTNRRPEENVGKIREFAQGFLMRHDELHEGHTLEAVSSLLQDGCEASEFMRSSLRRQGLTGTEALERVKKYALSLPMDQGLEVGRNSMHRKSDHAPFDVAKLERWEKSWTCANDIPGPRCWQLRSPSWLEPMLFINTLLRRIGSVEPKRVEPLPRLHSGSSRLREQREMLERTADRLGKYVADADPILDILEPGRHVEEEAEIDPEQWKLWKTALAGCIEGAKETARRYQDVGVWALRLEVAMKAAGRAWEARRASAEKDEDVAAATALAKLEEMRDFVYNVIVKRLQIVQHAWSNGLAVRLEVLRQCVNMHHGVMKLLAFIEDIGMDGGQLHSDFGTLELDARQCQGLLNTVLRGSIFLAQGALELMRSQSGELPALPDDLLKSVQGAMAAAIDLPRLAAATSASPEVYLLNHVQPLTEGAALNVLYQHEMDINQHVQDVYDILSKAVVSLKQMTDSVDLGSSVGDLLEFGSECVYPLAQLWRLEGLLLRQCHNGCQLQQWRLRVRRLMEWPENRNEVMEVPRGCQFPAHYHRFEDFRPHPPEARHLKDWSSIAKTERRLLHSLAPTERAALLWCSGAHILTDSLEPRLVDDCRTEDVIKYLGSSVVDLSEEQNLMRRYLREPTPPPLSPEPEEEAADSDGALADADATAEALMASVATLKGEDEAGVSAEGAELSEQAEEVGAHSEEDGGEARDEIVEEDKADDEVSRQGSAKPDVEPEEQAASDGEDAAHVDAASASGAGNDDDERASSSAASALADAPGSNASGRGTAMSVPRSAGGSAAMSSAASEWAGMAPSEAAKAAEEAAQVSGESQPDVIHAASNAATEAAISLGMDPSEVAHAVEDATRAAGGSLPDVLAAAAGGATQAAISLGMDPSEVARAAEEATIAAGGSAEDAAKAGGDAAYSASCQQGRRSSAACKLASEATVKYAMEHGMDPHDVGKIVADVVKASGASISQVAKAAGEAAAKMALHSEGISSADAAKLAAHAAAEVEDEAGEATLQRDSIVARAAGDAAIESALAEHLTPAEAAKAAADAAADAGAGLEDASMAASYAAAEVAKAAGLAPEDVGKAAGEAAKAAGGDLSADATRMAGKAAAHAAAHVAASAGLDPTEVGRAAGDAAKAAGASSEDVARATGKATARAAADEAKSAGLGVAEVGKIAANAGKEAGLSATDAARAAGKAVADAAAAEGLAAEETEAALVEAACDAGGTAEDIADIVAATRERSLTGLTDQSRGTVCSADMEHLDEAKGDDVPAEASCEEAGEQPRDEDDQGSATSRFGETPTPPPEAEWIHREQFMQRLEHARHAAAEWSRADLGLASSTPMMESDSTTVSRRSLEHRLTDQIEQQVLSLQLCHHELHAQVEGTPPDSSDVEIYHQTLRQVYQSARDILLAVREACFREARHLQDKAAGLIGESTTPIQETSPATTPTGSVSPTPTKSRRCKSASVLAESLTTNASDLVTRHGQLEYDRLEAFWGICDETELKEEIEDYLIAQKEIILKFHIEVDQSKAAAMEKKKDAMQQKYEALKALQQQQQKSMYQDAPNEEWAALFEEENLSENASSSGGDADSVDGESESSAESETLQQQLMRGLNQPDISGTENEGADIQQQPSEATAPTQQQGEQGVETDTHSQELVARALKKQKKLMRKASKDIAEEQEKLLHETMELAKARLARIQAANIEAAAEHAHAAADAESTHGNSSALDGNPFRKGKSLWATLRDNSKLKKPFSEKAKKRKSRSVFSLGKEKDDNRSMRKTMELVADEHWKEDEEVDEAKVDSESSFGADIENGSSVDEESNMEDGTEHRRISVADVVAEIRARRDSSEGAKDDEHAATYLVSRLGVSEAQLRLSHFSHEAAQKELLKAEKVLAKAKRDRGALRQTGFLAKRSANLLETLNQLAQLGNGAASGSGAPRQADKAVAERAVAFRTWLLERRVSESEAHVAFMQAKLMASLVSMHLHLTEHQMMEEELFGGHFPKVAKTRGRFAFGVPERPAQVQIREVAELYARENGTNPDEWMEWLLDVLEEEQEKARMLHHTAQRQGLEACQKAVEQLFDEWFGEDMVIKAQHRGGQAHGGSHGAKSKPGEDAAVERYHELSESRKKILALRRDSYPNERAIYREVLRIREGYQAFVAGGGLELAAAAALAATASEGLGAGHGNAFKFEQKIRLETRNNCEASWSRIRPAIAAYAAEQQAALLVFSAHVEDDPFVDELEAEERRGEECKVDMVALVMMILKRWRHVVEEAKGNQKVFEQEPEATVSFRRLSLTAGVGPPLKNAARSALPEGRKIAAAKVAPKAKAKAKAKAGATAGLLIGAEAAEAASPTTPAPKEARDTSAREISPPKRAAVPKAQRGPPFASSNAGIQASAKADERPLISAGGVPPKAAARVPVAAPKVPAAASPKRPVAKGKPKAKAKAPPGVPEGFALQADTFAVPAKASGVSRPTVAPTSAATAAPAASAAQDAPQGPLSLELAIGSLQPRTISRRRPPSPDVSRQTSTASLFAEAKAKAPAPTTGTAEPDEKPVPEEKPASARPVRNSVLQARGWTAMPNLRATVHPGALVESSAGEAERAKRTKALTLPPSVHRNLPAEDSEGEESGDEEKEEGVSALPSFSSPPRTADAQTDRWSGDRERMAKEAPSDLSASREHQGQPDDIDEWALRAFRMWMPDPSEYNSVAAVLEKRSGQEEGLASALAAAASTHEFTELMTMGRSEPAAGARGGRLRGPAPSFGTAHESSAASCDGYSEQDAASRCATSMTGSWLPGLPSMGREQTPGWVLQMAQNAAVVRMQSDAAGQEKAPPAVHSINYAPLHLPEVLARKPYVVDSDCGERLLVARLFSRGRAARRDRDGTPRGASRSPSTGRIIADEASPASASGSGGVPVRWTAAPTTDPGAGRRLRTAPSPGRQDSPLGSSPGVASSGGRIRSATTASPRKVPFNCPVAEAATGTYSSGRLLSDDSPRFLCGPPSSSSTPGASLPRLEAGTMSQSARGFLSARGHGASQRRVATAVPQLSGAPASARAYAGRPFTTSSSRTCFAQHPSATSLAHVSTAASLADLDVAEVWSRCLREVKPDIGSASSRGGEGGRSQDFLAPLLQPAGQATTAAAVRR
eukprot:TRINITY_DN2693_c0_g1_i1.p1 TRINITY_DN2693_c0_g1~~TRINITY_DN2693_c0_g1_i1.p1  ORF type:complete len:3841 (+),score=919.17 TRINITY_DN2693_c0_g1_i1:390-11912(+)